MVGVGGVSSGCTSLSGRHKLAILQCSSRWQARVLRSRCLFSFPQSCHTGQQQLHGEGGGELSTTSTWLRFLKCPSELSLLYKPYPVLERRLLEQKENGADNWTGGFPSVNWLPKGLNFRSRLGQEGRKEKAGEVPKSHSGPLIRAFLAVTSA